MDGWMDRKKQMDCWMYKKNGWMDGYKTQMIFFNGWIEKMDGLQKIEGWLEGQKKG